MKSVLLAALFLLLAGCGADPDDRAGAAGGAPGVPVLGAGAHEPSSVELAVIATQADGLDLPRDLAFNPEAPEQLWALSFGASSVTILFDAGTAQQTASVRSGPGGTHFLAKPSALAFGAPGFMATAQDEDEPTQPTTPDTFMGPTLWTTDVSTFDAGHASHYDMLHNSPSSVGIAWEAANAYWVFDGHHGALTRYDFHEDHGPGGEDHSDGEIARYVEGEVERVEGVAGHLELDRETGLLYVADTGNARVAVLNTKTGTRGAKLTPNYDSADQYRVDGAALVTLADASVGLEHPSGIALEAGHVFVGDHATGKIFAFALDGTLVDWLDTGLGKGLGGIAFDASGQLYAAHAERAEIVRIAPRTEPR